MTAKERILITVKTYPTISKSYGELVCTAGFREDGSWVRLYPVPFRRMTEYQKFQKYQWMTARLRRRIGKDRRPESYSPDLDSLGLHEQLSTGKSREWAGRKDLILKKGTIYDDLAAIIKMANANTLSLATFKPTEILEVTHKAVTRNWTKEQIATVDGFHRQGDLFAEDSQFPEQFRLVKKLPYNFYYRYRDSKGKESCTLGKDRFTPIPWNDPPVSRKIQKSFPYHRRIHAAANESGRAGSFFVN